MKMVAPGRRCSLLQHPSSWQLVNASERVQVCNVCTLAWRKVYRWRRSEVEADRFVQQLRRESAPRVSL